jgi:hypothetical protein
MLIHFSSGKLKARGHMVDLGVDDKLYIPSASTISNSALCSQAVLWVSYDSQNKQHKATDNCKGEVLCFLSGRKLIFVMT